MSSHSSRHSDQGVTLITTLLMLILLASIATLAQQRAMASVRVLTGLTAETKAQLQEHSAYATLKPHLMQSLIANTNAPGSEVIALNGTPYLHQAGDIALKIRAYDPQSLPDIWLTEAEVVAKLLPLSAAEIEAFRSDHPRESILHPLQARALLGLGAEGLFTISGKETRLNIRNWPVQAPPWEEVLQRWQAWDAGAERGVLRIKHQE